MSIGTLTGLATLASVTLFSPPAPQASPRPVYGSVEMEGDRPDVTESALVVPPRVFQIEGGATWERARERENSFQAAELSLRYGAWDRFEWRFQVPNFFRFLSGDERREGFGDPLVGFKYQIGPLTTGTDVAVIVHASLPTGADRITTGHVDPEMKIPFSHALGGPWSFNGQVSFFLPAVDDTHEFLYQQTASIARDLSPVSGAFIEYIGEFARLAPDAHQLHAGYTNKVRPDLQLDVHAAFGLNEAAPDVFVGTGFVWRP